MQELVEYLAQYLVDEPDKVQVKMVETDRETRLQLLVASGDMGRVIGKQGRIARAIRTVVKAAAARGHQRVELDIDAIDEGQGNGNNH